MSTSVEGSEIIREVPLQGMRAVIARNLTSSLREMAQLTLQRRIHAPALVAYRAQFDQEWRPSINSLMLALVAMALTHHPGLNATLEDETVRLWRPVHLGMAVATDNGLVVPVIRDAASRDLRSIHEDAERLGRMAREGMLSLADLRGGTFTVTNLGAYGVDGFTPIINPPQVAILGVGRIDRESITLSLTFDHRALDGVPAALFLQEVSYNVEHPKELLG